MYEYMQLKFYNVIRTQSSKLYISCSLLCQVAQVSQVDSKYGTEASHVKKNSSKRELQWE